MKNLFIILIFLKFKLISAQIDCSDIAPIYTGTCFDKHPNGKISWIKEFKNGRAIGTWMYFNDKGVLVKQLNTTLKSDSLDKVFDEVIKVQSEKENWVEHKKSKNVVKIAEEEIYTFVDEVATFSGDLQIYIKKNVVYPVEAIDNFIEGKVYVRFVIEKDGSVTNVNIVRGISECESCEKEAKRVVKAMPNWNPAKKQGNAVRSIYELPIIFSVK